jgi:hypothetical protein
MDLRRQCHSLRTGSRIPADLLRCHVPGLSSDIIGGKKRALMTREVLIVTVASVWPCCPIPSEFGQLQRHKTPARHLNAVAADHCADACIQGGFPFSFLL